MTATQSYVTYISNGVVTDFTFSFPYLEREHILVLLDEVETTSFTFAASGTIRLNTAPANGVEIIIRRQTPKNSALLEIQTKSTLKSSELNAQILQTLYASQEAVDTSELIRAGGLTIPSVEDAKDDAEAAKDLAIVAQGLAETARDEAVNAATPLATSIADAQAALLAANAAQAAAQALVDSIDISTINADIDAKADQTEVSTNTAFKNKFEEPSTGDAGKVLAVKSSEDGYEHVELNAGGSLFKGNNGEVGSSAGDIFRVNSKTLTSAVTIDSDENASTTGPLTIADGVTLTIADGGVLAVL